MHKLIGYICDELEDLERKTGKDGKLSMQELQYADTLAHLKKNLLKAEEMSESSEYSRSDHPFREVSRDYVRPDGSYREGDSSYARGRGSGARRDSMGRYSSESVDEHTKAKLREMIEQM